MSIHPKIDGSFEKVEGVYFKQNGSWSQITEVHYNDEGTWKLVFPGYQFSPVIFWSITSSEDSNDVLDGGARPLDLTASRSTINKNDVVNLEWNVFSEEIVDHYDVYRADTSGGSFSEISSSDVTQKSYSDTNVNGNTNKYYKVRAITENSVETQPSNEDSYIPPEFVSYSATADQALGKIDLSWSYEGRELEFKVLRASTSGGSYTEVATVSGSSYKDIPPDDGSWYYKVQSLSNDDANIVRETSEKSGTLEPTNEVYTISNDGKLKQYRFKLPYEFESVAQTREFDYSVDAQFGRFKPDGTKHYAVRNYLTGESTESEVISYEMTTPWDVETSTNRKSHVFSDNIEKADFYISDDGQQLFAINTCGLQGFCDISIFDFGTAWDITTLSFNRTVESIDRSKEQLAFTFGDNGTKYYIVEDTFGNPLTEYNLNVSYDPSQGKTKVASIEVMFDLIYNGFRNLRFNETGNKLFVKGDLSFLEYNLSTPWEISSASLVQTGDIDSTAIANESLVYINKISDISNVSN